MNAAQKMSRLAISRLKAKAADQNVHQHNLSLLRMWAANFATQLLDGGQTGFTVSVKQQCVRKTTNQATYTPVQRTRYIRPP